MATQLTSGNALAMDGGSGVAGCSIFVLGIGKSPLAAPMLPKFRARYPAVTIDLRLDDRHVDLIKEGIGVAIRIGDLADSRLLSRRLMAMHLCAYASPAYLAARGTPRHPEELATHGTINLRYQSNGQMFRWPFRTGERVIEIVPAAAIVVDASDVALAAMVAGGGIGMAATFAAAAHVATGRLVPVLADHGVEGHPVTIVWPESRRAKPRRQGVCLHACNIAA